MIEAQAGLQPELGQVASVGPVALVVLAVALRSCVYVITTIEQKVKHGEY